MRTHPFPGSLVLTLRTVEAQLRTNGALTPGRHFSQELMQAAAVLQCPLVAVDRWRGGGYKRHNNCNILCGVSTGYGWTGTGPQDRVAAANMVLLWQA